MTDEVNLNCWWSAVLRVIVVAHLRFYYSHLFRFLKLFYVGLGAKSKVGAKVKYLPLFLEIARKFAITHRSLASFYKKKTQIEFLHTSCGFMFFG